MVEERRSLGVGRVSVEIVVRFIERAVPEDIVAVLRRVERTLIPADQPAKRTFEIARHELRDRRPEGVIRRQALMVAARHLQQRQGQMEEKLRMGGELVVVALGLAFQPGFEVRLNGAKARDRELGQRCEPCGDVALEEGGPVASARIAGVVILDVLRQALAEQDEIREVALVRAKIVRGELCALAAGLGHAGPHQWVSLRAQSRPCQPSAR